MPELRLPLLPADVAPPLRGWLTELVRELQRQDVLKMRRALALHPDGLFIRDASNNVIGVADCRRGKTVLQSVSGATATATALIPAGAFVFGVFAQNLTAITGTLTSYQVGTAADPDAWDTAHQLVAPPATPEGITPTNNGCRNTPKDFTARNVALYPADTDVVLTAIGGTFSAGDIELTARYVWFE